jgi:heptosyltransferase II
MKIVIRMPNWLGDFLMALPLLEDIKKHHPLCVVTMLAPAPFLDLVRENPYVDELVPLTKKRLSKSFDIGILTTNSISSAWHFFKSPIKKRIGFKTDKRGLLLNGALPIPKERGQEHLVATYKRLLEPLNIPLSDTAPKIYLKNEEISAFAKKIQLSREGFIGLHPLAAYGPAKCWPQEYFREVISYFLKNSNEEFLFFGTAAERIELENLCAGLPHERLHILAGKTTLRELACAMKLCKLIVSNDSGPMHLAASLNIPLIALFGSTEPVVTAPYQHGIVLQKPTFCSPCFKRKCPIDFRCMRELSPEYLIEEMKRELGCKTAKPLHVVYC